MVAFFCAKNLVGHYSIYYDIKNYSNELDAIFDKYGGIDFGEEGLFISNLVKINTDLKEKPLRKCKYHADAYEYNYFFTNLKEELKEI